jgi:hypothetical protein
MKKILFLLTLLIVGCIPAFSQSTARINFRRGGYSAIVSGSLYSYKSERTYLLRVREGQTIRTEQIKPSQSPKYVTIHITDPNGIPVGDSDASCNDRREISPTVPGDYRIRVVECQKADPWKGWFRFKIAVR